MYTGGDGETYYSFPNILSSEKPYFVIIVERVRNSYISLCIHFTVSYIQRKDQIYVNVVPIHKIYIEKNTRGLVKTVYIYIYIRIGQNMYVRKIQWNRFYRSISEIEFEFYFQSMFHVKFILCKLCMFLSIKI